MVKIIFLDFDGVMDTSYYDLILHKNGLSGNDSFGVVFDPNCVRNLKEIIDRTGADIVVSSSWKHFMTYKDFLDMWEYRGLPGFVTDVTPTPPIRRNRGDEIDAWLEDCREECRYAIIDDFDGSNFNPHQIEHLFVVNPYWGLDEDTAKRVVDHLSKDDYH